MSSLLQRLMEPSEFIILQDLFFASFNSVDPALLGISALVVAAGGLFAWRRRHRLDVLALGRQLAVNVGVDHRRTVMGVLLVCSLLVAVSTALVGPVTFFGLLVVSLGRADPSRDLAMKGGRLLHQGTPADTMQPEVLRDIYEIDIRIEEIDGNTIGVYFA